MGRRARPRLQSTLFPPRVRNRLVGRRPEPGGYHRGRGQRLILSKFALVVVAFFVFFAARGSPDSLLSRSDFARYQSGCDFPLPFSSEKRQYTTIHVAGKRASD